MSLFFSRPVSCASWGCSPADVFEEPGGAIAGSWTWHGRLAVFSPRSPLADAKRFRLRVRDVLAEGGASLTGEREVVFETPRAALVGAEYMYNADTRAHVVTARFDAQVDPAEAARRLHVEGRAKGRAASWGLGRRVRHEEPEGRLQGAPDRRVVRRGRRGAPRRGASSPSTPSRARRSPSTSRPPPPRRSRTPRSSATPASSPTAGASAPRRRSAVRSRGSAASPRSSSASVPRDRTPARTGRTPPSASPSPPTSPRSGLASASTAVR